MAWDQSAWWNYRVQVIQYVHELPPGERAAFDGMLRGAYGSDRVGKRWFEPMK